MAPSDFIRDMVEVGSVPFQARPLAQTLGSAWYKAQSIPFQLAGPPILTFVLASRDFRLASDSKIADFHSPLKVRKDL